MHDLEVMILNPGLVELGVLLLSKTYFTQKVAFITKTGSMVSNNSDQIKSTYLFTSRPFLKTAGGIGLGSVAVSAISVDVLLYISVAIKASF